MAAEEATYDAVKNVLHNDEMSALWNWHMDREHEAAGKGNYDDAKWHKQRRSLFYREPNTPP